MFSLYGVPKSIKKAGADNTPGNLQYAFMNKAISPLELEMSKKVGGKQIPDPIIPPKDKISMIIKCLAAKKR